MTNSNHLYLILGASGSGKNEVTKRVSERLKYRVLESYTTRQPRFEGESGHLFVSDEEYDALPNKIAEVSYSDARYCATTTLLWENEIYIVEPSGIVELSNQTVTPRDFRSIFLSASEDVRRERMKMRGDSEDQIEARIQNDREWFSSNLVGFLCDTQISNEEEIDACVEAVIAYIEREEKIAEKNLFFRSDCA